MNSEALDAATIALQVISGFAIFCNLVVMTVFATSKQLRSMYYGFLFNLVLADITAPALAIVQQQQPGKVPISLVRASFCVASLSVLAVAVNRLLAFSMPRDRFRAMVTRGRMVTACLLIWVVSAAIYIPLSFVEAQALYLMRPLLALIIIGITGIVYYLVFRKIARYSATTSCCEDDEESSNRVRQTRNLMVTFTIILATSLFCWLPFCVGNFAVYSSNKNSSEQSLSFRVFYKSSLTILLINSLINPFIYWWRIGEFRHGLPRVFCARRNQPIVNVELVTTLETVM